MPDNSTIVGIFFAEESNLIYESIKINSQLEDKDIEEIRMLPFKYLGPVFLTAASGGEQHWKIDLIESSISLSVTHTQREQADIMQSFFNITSSIDTAEGSTNLFALIGSPHTEDIKDIQDRVVEYIHPSIIQGRIVKEALEENFHKDKFIKAELERGADLIRSSLGSSRKMYWEEMQEYYCVGIVERTVNYESNIKTSELFTFKPEDELRKRIQPNIPSFYVLSILPNYYEDQIRDTLKLFGKKGIAPNIRKIKLNSKDNGAGIKHVIYLEEFKEENNMKKSYGAILIPQIKSFGDSERISYFRKLLRKILDSTKKVEDILQKINPFFSNKRWSTTSEEDLMNIQKYLDSD